VSHTLHRRGTASSLQGDFVVLMMAAKGVNDAGAAPRLQEFLRLAGSSGAVNIGDMTQGSWGSGSTLPQLEEGVADTSIVHAAFSSLDAAEEFIRALRNAELGLSVTLTGLLEPVQGLCRRLGLGTAPHTVAFSLGILGRTESLPKPEVLEITTMCGHGLVSPRLVEKTVEDIRSGSSSPETASRTLSGPCTCGIFNPERAAALLARLAATAAPREDEHASRPESH
jgi:hypothetical protein